MSEARSNTQWRGWRRWATLSVVPIALGAIAAAVGFAVTDPETYDEPIRPCGGSTIRVAFGAGSRLATCGESATTLLWGSGITFVLAIAALWFVVRVRRRLRTVTRHPMHLIPVEMAAISEPTTAGWLRRQRRSMMWSYVAGTLLFAAGCAGATIDESRAEQFEARGVHVDGTVTGVGGDVGYSTASVSVDYAVNGQIHTGTVNVDNQYDRGQQVDVVYDRDDPDSFTIAGESNDPFWVTAAIGVLFVAGVFGLVGGAVMVVRSWRWRHALRSEPWTKCQVVILAAPTWGQTLLVFRDGPFAGSVVGINGTPNWRPAAVTASAPLIWCVGRPDDRLVVAPHGGAPLASAGPSRWGRRQRKWERLATYRRV